MAIKIKEQTHTNKYPCLNCGGNFESVYEVTVGKRVFKLCSGCMHKLLIKMIAVGKAK